MRLFSASSPANQLSLQATREGALACLFICSHLAAAQAIAEDRLLLLCMPDQDPLTNRPTDKEIGKFVEAHRERLDMTVAELATDPRREFARRVLGQTQIVRELAEFEKKAALKTKVRFVAWQDAFRHYEDYASAGNFKISGRSPGFAGETPGV